MPKTAHAVRPAHRPVVVLILAAALLGIVGLHGSGATDGHSRADATVSLAACGYCWTSG